MAIYIADANGNERARIILVDSNGNSVITGNPITAQGPYYTDANGNQYLLAIAYDEDGNEQ
jgi:hypothetical protein